MYNPTCILEKWREADALRTMYVLADMCIAVIEKWLDAVRTKYVFLGHVSHIEVAGRLENNVCIS